MWKQNTFYWHRIKDNNGHYLRKAKADYQQAVTVVIIKKTNKNKASSFDVFVNNITFALIPRAFLIIGNVKRPVNSNGKHPLFLHFGKKGGGLFFYQGTIVLSIPYPIPVRVHSVFPSRSPATHGVNPASRRLDFCPLLLPWC